MNEEPQMAARTTSMKMKRNFKCRKPAGTVRLEK